MPAIDEKPHFAADDYHLFQEFLSRACGIVLGDNKQYLVANRLRRILSDQDVGSLRALVQKIESRQVSGLKEQVIDAMTTNETFWFRDNFPFETLRDALLPRLVKEEKRPALRIWSAACSFGQEPYSISMLIEEFKQRNPWVLRSDPVITATDISSAALNTAKRAVYDRLSVNRGLSAERRDRFFREVEPGQFQLDRSITSRVSFRQMNLLESYTALGQFDIILCRNVLIYFAADIKIDILRRMHAQLKPGSYLILGASESMPAALNSLFTLERINGQTTVYRS